jgi:hypothetical protein
MTIETSHDPERSVTLESTRSVIGTVKGEEGLVCSVNVMSAVYTPGLRPAGFAVTDSDVGRANELD